MKENRLSKRSPVDDDKDFEEGEHEGDIYDGEGRDKLEEGDEITEVEEGFVEGYEKGEAKCAECGVVLVDKDFVEEELDGKYYRFCSTECASAFESGKKRKQGKLSKKSK